LGFQVLAFADHSYLIDVGSDHEPPLLTIGWVRRRPNSISFSRRRKPPHPPANEELEPGDGLFRETKQEGPG